MASIGAPNQVWSGFVWSAPSGVEWLRLERPPQVWSGFVWSAPSGVERLRLERPLRCGVASIGAPPQVWSLVQAAVLVTKYQGGGPRGLKKASLMRL